MKHPLCAALVTAFTVATIGLLAACSRQDGEGAKVNVKAMTAALKGADKDARINACIELAKAGPRAEPAVESLIPLLKDSDPLVRRLAAYALGQVGPKASQSLPALKGLLGDPDYNVQTAALNATRAIDPKAVDANIQNIQTR